MFSTALSSESHAGSKLVAPFLRGPALSWELGVGLYGTIDLSAETHFLAVQRSSFEHDATKLSFALRSSFGLGKRF